MWAWIKRGACLGCVLLPVGLVVLLVVLVVVPMVPRVGATGRGPVLAPAPSCFPLGVAPASPGAFRRVVGPGC